MRRADFRLLGAFYVLGLRSSKARVYSGEGSVSRGERFPLGVVGRVAVVAAPLGEFVEEGLETVDG